MSLHPIRLSVGQNLRLARLSTGLSLAVIETKTGGRWKAGRVASWETCARSVTCEQADELARFYGFKLADLMPEMNQAIVNAARRAGITV